jgi:hypothetical protein
VSVTTHHCHRYLIIVVPARASPSTTEGWEDNKFQLCDDALAAAIVTTGSVGVDRRRRNGLGFGVARTGNNGGERREEIHRYVSFRVSFFGGEGVIQSMVFS